MGRNNIKVSIIISVYNTEKYLRKCLDSLVSQSLSPIEIIAVNNGSTDNSLDILRDYEKKYSSYFKVVSLEKNTGDPAIPWNLGIEMARGEYVSIVDSDDWCEVNAFERYYKFAQKGDYNIVISNHYEVRSENDIIPIDSIDRNREISTKELILSPHLAPWGKIIKKTVYTNNNLKYVSQIHCDTGLNMIMYSKVSKVYVIDEHLYYYNQMNPNSETNTKKRMRQAKIVDTLDHIIKNYDDQWEQEMFLSLVSFLRWFCFEEYKFHMDIFIPFIQRYSEEIKRNKYIRNNVNGLKSVLKLLDKQLVPKKIVYATFGQETLSELEKICVDSWKEYTSNYEICILNEQNFNVHEYKCIEMAYNNKDYKLVNFLAILVYVQKNGGFGLSKKLKMNAPIGELRMNEVNYVVDQNRNVFPSFVSATPNNELLLLLLDKIELEVKNVSFQNVFKTVNDFEHYIANGKEQTLKNQEFSVKPFSIDRIGYNLDGNNLFELMDEEIYEIICKNKKIGKVLTVEQKDYLEKYFSTQEKRIQNLSTRIYQLENSRTWRYSRKLRHFITWIKKLQLKGKIIYKFLLIP